MKKTELYTQEELELFKALENDVDNNTYEPMKKRELEKAKEYYKSIAENKNKNFKIIQGRCTRHRQIYDMQTNLISVQTIVGVRHPDLAFLLHGTYLTYENFKKSNQKRA